MPNSAPLVYVTSQLTTRPLVWGRVTITGLNFTYTDADGDTAVKFRFTDLGADPSSMMLWVNGVSVAQGGSAEIAASSAWDVWLKGGAVAGSDTLRIQVFDGINWSAGGDVTVITQNAIPVVTATGAISARPATWLQGSLQSLKFSYADGDGDAAVAYRFTDVGTAASSMRMWGNGAYVAQGGTIDVAASNLASFWLQGGSLGTTDTLRVQAFDGFEWSAAKDITVTTANAAPVVTVTGSISARPLTWLQGSLQSLKFSYADGDGDAAVAYRFTDVSAATNSMHMWGNGGYVAQGGTIEVAANNLATFWLQGGSVGGSDTLRVQAFDGFEWSAAKDITVTTGNAAPVVTVTGSISARPLTWLQGSLQNLKFSYADGDADAAVAYRFIDVGTAGSSMRMWGNGGYVAQGGTIDVAANNLASFWLQGGSGGGSDTLRVQAFDGFEWSAAKDITVTTANAAPVVTTNGSVAIHQGTWLRGSLANLKFSYADGDGDAAVAYRFTDVSATAGSMHLWGNGTDLAQGATVEIAAANLPGFWLQGGAGTDTLRVQAFDGFDWSAAKDITVTNINNAPVIATTGPISVHPSAWLRASLQNFKFTSNDGDGDPIVAYRLTDVGTGANSMHLWGNGANLAQGATIEVSASNLSSVWLQGGTANGSDTLRVQAFDGSAWSAASDIVVNTGNSVPVVSVSALVQVQPSAWLQGSVSALKLDISDDDGDSIVTYRFTDLTSTAGSMQIWGNGAYAAQGGTIEVSAANLSNFWIKGGSTNGQDQLQVQVFDGYAWSTPNIIPVSTRPPNHTPTIATYTTKFGLDQTVAASTIFAGIDSDFDPVQQYWIKDSSSGGGRFYLNGSPLADGSELYFSGLIFDQLSFKSSSTNKTVDTITVAANDGFGWGPDKTFTISSIGSNAVPTITPKGNIALNYGQWLKWGSGNLGFTVTDADGETPVLYRFTDMGGASSTMHMYAKGAHQAQGATVELTPAELADFWIQGGQSSSADTLRVQVFDGYDWSSALSSISVNTGPTPDHSKFNITLEYTGDPAYRTYFQQAAARWEQVIVGEMSDHYDSTYGVIDDILIKASIGYIDGTGGVYGGAIIDPNDPDHIRIRSVNEGDDRWTPYFGAIKLEADDMADMLSQGILYDVILHEMGHALGFGTDWDVRSLSNGLQYTGPRALAEYRNAMNNQTLTYVPLENDGGSNSAGIHWEKDIFGRELMTYTSPITPSISRVTIGSFEDIGYRVNYAAADTAYAAFTGNGGSGSSATNGTLNVAGFSASSPLDVYGIAEFNSAAATLAQLLPAAPPSAIPAAFSNVLDPFADLVNDQWLLV